MTTQGMIADADGDIAALVYRAGDRPDLVLCAFAEHLAAAGKRLCGLVQFRDGPRDGSPGRVMVLDSWQIVEVGGKRDQAANSHCRLDARWLDQMGTQAKTSIEQGVDTVIVNRFGPLEAAGRGFRDAILAASETQTSLIIAVPVSLGIALCLTHYAHRRVATSLGFFIDLLAAVPSVVFGLWGRDYLAGPVSDLSAWLHESFGTNFRMIEMQAVLGRIQLRRMADMTARRTAAAQAYRSALARFEGAVRAPEPRPGLVHAYYRLYAYVRPEGLRHGWTRDRIVAEESDLDVEADAAGEGHLGEGHEQAAVTAIVVRGNQLLRRELLDAAVELVANPLQDEPVRGDQDQRVAFGLEL